MIRSVIALVFAVVLASCASKPIVAVPKPTIKSIAIVPATNPLAYTIYNANPALVMFFPIASLGYSLDGRAKAKLFTEKVIATKVTLGLELTNAMAASLREYGYSVQVLENVKRAPNAPDDIDYDNIEHSADALVHLSFSEVGLLSPRLSTQYVPRLNASGVVFVRGHRDYLYDETIYYGADAREGKRGTIVADAKFAYLDFDFVLNNLSSVLGAFSAGAREVAKRMSEQIHEAVK